MIVGLLELALVARGRVGSDLALAQVRRNSLHALVVALAELGSFGAPLRADLVVSVLGNRDVVTEVARLGAGTSSRFIAHSIAVHGVDAVQEVRIATVSIAISLDGLRALLGNQILLAPLIRVVGAFRVLEFVQQDLVLVDYSRQTANAISSVQTLIRV